MQIPLPVSRVSATAALLSSARATARPNCVRPITHCVGDRGAQFQQLPKVELHRHLEGAVRLSTVLEEAQRHDVRLPHGPDATLTPANQLTLNGLRPHLQALQKFPDLAGLLAIFDHTQSTFADAASISRIAHEAVIDAHTEGIRLLELRYAPSIMSMGHGHSFSDVLTAIELGIESAQRELGGDRIAVGLICIGVGAMGHEEMQKTVDFLLQHRDRFIGFDMAGAEQNPMQFAEHFLRVGEAGVPITCHAAEDLLDGLPANVHTAVLELGAARIGHGVQIYKVNH